MNGCIPSLVSSQQPDTNSLPAVQAGTPTHTRHSMTRLSKAMTSIATGMALGSIGDLGLMTSQWLTAIITIAVGFGLICYGFVLLGTQSCVK